MSDTKRPTDTIGGTDVAKILGISPYGGPIDVYRSMVEGYVQPETEPMRRGTRFEPVIRQLYVDETGATLKPHPGVVRNKKYPFAHVSPDDFAVNDGADVYCEYKSVGAYVARDWGHENDEIPLPHLCQVAWGFAMTDLVAADVCALIGVDDFRRFRIIRDRELEAMLLEKVERFYVDHIKARVPPAVDGSDSTAEWLKARYPESRGETLEATPEIESDAHELRRIRGLLEEYEAKEKELRNRMVAFIGNADGVRGIDWKVTYRSAKGAAKVDWESVAKEANAPEHLVQKYTSIKSGGRRFLPKFFGANGNE